VLAVHEFGPTKAKLTSAHMYDWSTWLFLVQIRCRHYNHINARLYCQWQFS